MSEIFNTAPLQLIPETYSKFGQFYSISFWSTVCFIFLVTKLFIPLQNKLKIRFHWIKSIYRSVYNILGFTQKNLCSSNFSIITWNKFGYFYQAVISVEVVYHQTLTGNHFCLVRLGYSVYVVFDILSMT